MHYITPSAYRGKWYKHKQSYCVVNYRLQDVHIIELYPISYSTVSFGKLDDGGIGGLFGGVFIFQGFDGHFIQGITAY